MKTLWKIVAAVIVLAVIATGGLFLYTNMDSTGNINVFSVKYNGENITASKADVAIPRGVSNFFEVKSLVNSGDYTVKIVTLNVTLDYKKDGKTQGFSAIGDLTPGFKLTLTEYGFFLFLPKDFTMKALLQSVMPDNVIEVEEVKWEKDYFRLIVTSGDGQKVITIDFH